MGVRILIGRGMRVAVEIVRMMGMSVRFGERECRGEGEDTIRKCWMEKKRHE
jgi:hypothetical protein